MVNRLIDLLHTYGYRVAGFRAARTAQGWRTAVIADGKGFPDLLAFRESDGRRVAIECKIPPDKLGPEQLDWANVLKTCKVEWYMVTPADWEQMSEVLQ
ncbi:MAG: VRR-NUC domain-containing protein [Spirochaetota bacterium]